jgi:hypothetical protein
MRVINKMNLNPVATFPQIAKELGENEGAVFETYRRALIKLQVALRRKGYKIDDFFGEIRNDH